MTSPVKPSLIRKVFGRPAAPRDRAGTFSGRGRWLGACCLLAVCIAAGGLLGGYLHVPDAPAPVSKRYPVERPKDVRPEPTIRRVISLEELLIPLKGNKTFDFLSLGLSVSVAFDRRDAFTSGDIAHIRGALYDTLSRNTYSRNAPMPFIAFKNLLFDIIRQQITDGRVETVHITDYFAL